MQHAVAAFGLGALDYLLQLSGSQLPALTSDLVRATIRQSDITPALNGYSEMLRRVPISRLIT